MIVKLELSLTGAKTIIRALDHLRGQAEGTTRSTYGIDDFCRADTATRLRELRTYINSRIPKKYRVT